MSNARVPKFVDVLHDLIEFAKGRRGELRSDGLPDTWNVLAALPGIAQAKEQRPQALDGAPEDQIVPQIPLMFFKQGPFALRKVIEVGVEEGDGCLSIRRDEGFETLFQKALRVLVERPQERLKGVGQRRMSGANGVIEQQDGLTHHIGYLGGRLSNICFLQHPIEERFLAGLSRCFL